MMMMRATTTETAIRRMDLSGTDNCINFGESNFGIWLSSGSSETPKGAKQGLRNKRLYTLVVNLLVFLPFVFVFCFGCLSLLRCGTYDTKYWLECYHYYWKLLVLRA